MKEQEDQDQRKEFESIVQLGTTENITDHSGLGQSPQDTAKLPQVSTAEANVNVSSDICDIYFRSNASYVQ